MGSVIYLTFFSAVMQVQWFTDWHWLAGWLHFLPADDQSKTQSTSARCAAWTKKNCWY